MRLTALLLALSGPGAAQEWIDYELLMAQQGARVQVATDAEGRVSRTVDMGDGVTVTCSWEGCFGFDTEGAVGCAFMIVSDLRAAMLACPDPATFEQADVIEELEEDIGRFVAENGVPRRNWPDLQEDLAESTAHRIAEYSAACDIIASADSGFLDILEAYSRQDVRSELLQLLSRPRLPVLNPCL